MELCQICHRREANFEGLICWECKLEQDALDFEEEVERYESEMLTYNHKGETCWLDGRLCQEGYCNECQVYYNWKGGTKCLMATHGLRG